MEQYGIIRANKIKYNSISKQLQKHIQRQSNYYNSNLDINISKIKDDVILIYSEDYKKSINQILQKYNITKPLRKNAVGMIDGVLTASPDFFVGKSREEIINFFKNGLEEIKKEFGSEVFSCAIHFDEKTPHMHWCASCLVFDEKNDTYKWSAKDLMGNKKQYIERQDRFYENFFKRYGLNRGKSVKETHRKHIEASRYKAEKARGDYIESIKNTNNQKAITQDLMIEDSELQSKINNAKNTYDEIILESEKALNDFEETLNEIDLANTRKDKIIKKIKSLEELYDNLKNYLIQLANNSPLFDRLLENAILSGGFDDIEELTQTKKESDEAKNILDYMNESYNKYQTKLEYEDELEL
ncbi:MAG: plasmid recombination protein [Clostridia bacterium]|nr:plasmid recombination protein [Clostridia bacterium]MBR2176294.1 plasmid recombination protein [Clostridia bacterium]